MRLRALSDRGGYFLRRLAPRRVRDSDVGSVFLRVDDARFRGYHVLRSIGTGQHPILHFTTFEMEGRSVARVGDTGYVNGRWFVRAQSLPPEVLAEVDRREEVLVAERRADIARARREADQASAEAKARYGRPVSWSHLETGEVRDSDLRFVLWYDDQRFELIVDIYDRWDRRLASRSRPASHEPTFGLNVLDHQAIFGDTGWIREMVHGLGDIERPG
jgi:hypothetical protein